MEEGEGQEKRSSNNSKEAVSQRYLNKGNGKKGVSNKNSKRTNKAPSKWLREQLGGVITRGGKGWNWILKRKDFWWKKSESKGKGDQNLLDKKSHKRLKEQPVATQNEKGGRTEKKFWNGGPLSVGKVSQQGSQICKRENLRWWTSWGRRDG